jgi:hypothetical protein
MSIVKRIVLPLVAVSLLALSACSSDSESTASGALPNNPTKAQYIESANAICNVPFESSEDKSNSPSTTTNADRSLDAATDEFRRAAEDGLQAIADFAERPYDALKPWLDFLDQRINELDALAKPTADEVELSTAYKELRDAVAKIRTSTQAVQDRTADTDAKATEAEQNITQGFEFLEGETGIVRYGATRCLWLDGSRIDSQADTNAKNALNAIRNAVDNAMGDEIDYRLITFGDGGPVDIAESSGDIQLVTTGSTGPESISFTTGGDTFDSSFVTFAALSESGSCFYLRLNGSANNNGQTQRATVANASADTCKADSTDVNWQSDWD